MNEERPNVTNGGWCIDMEQKQNDGDLISREALKNYARTVLCEDNATNRSLLRIFDEIIDNAPSDNEVN